MPGTPLAPTAPVPQVSMYRALALTPIAAALLSLTAPSEAQAFGDTCLRDVRAKGSVQNSMGRARSAAITAWESTVRQRHGSRFANWYYSGDRTIDCSWDNSGTQIRCSAIALPCGRKA
jgi:hypothetical protein